MPRTRPTKAISSRSNGLLCLTRSSARSPGHLLPWPRYAAIIMVQKPRSEPLDLAEHPPLEGLLKEGSTPADLFNVMVRLGLFSEQENMDVLLHHKPLHLPQEAYAWADVCSRSRSCDLSGWALTWRSSSPLFSSRLQEILDRPPPDRDQEHRWDLGHLPVYTIDPRNAHEIDDGLSLEHNPKDNSAWIYIHTADPTRHTRLNAPCMHSVAGHVMNVILWMAFGWVVTDGCSQTVLSIS